MFVDLLANLDVRELSYHICTSARPCSYKKQKCAAYFSHEPLIVRCKSMDKSSMPECKPQGIYVKRTFKQLLAAPEQCFGQCGSGEYWV
uniref:Uncharacterized protein n=1 Tax=Pyxicephalus adspersus TaxID=30357 RepID=A0AAV3AMX1_PYXAD|nr:TPA: hypothetical protein GDO54_014395 [Pyxicephalus adspersus]